MGRDEVSVLCSLFHSFPAAPLVCWLPRQHSKPSACIQHDPPSLQRGGCARRDRLLCSQLTANSKAKPQEAQRRRALEGLL